MCNWTCTRADHTSWILGNLLDLLRDKFRVLYKWWKLHSMISEYNVLILTLRLHDALIFISK